MLPLAQLLLLIAIFRALFHKAPLISFSSSEPSTPQFMMKKKVQNKK